MSPYQILNLAPDATDAEIREAYLRLVRRYPPTQFPEHFSRIARAYGKIDTPEKRLDYKLLGDPDPPYGGTFVEEVIDLVRFQRKRPGWEDLKQAMQQGS
jgi:curved DNA-binding protein CbpA